MVAVGALRLVGGLVALAVLFYWTIRRIMGDGEDPTLRTSNSTETGYASVLVSGSYAVAAVVVIAGWLFWPWIRSSPGLVVPMVLIVGAHIWWEGTERD